MQIENDVLKEIKSEGEIYIGPEVRNIAEKAAFLNFDLSSVIMSKNSVEVISEQAFMGANLEGGVTLSENLKEIGEEAFAFSFLKSIKLPSQVSIIKEKTFSECVQLETVVLPMHLEKIEQRAFYMCWNLENLVIPDGTKEIGDDAFNGTPLKKLVLPQSITHIGRRALPNSLQKVTIKANSHEEYKRVKALLPKCLHDRVEPENTLLVGRPELFFHGAEEIKDHKISQEVPATTSDRDVFENAYTPHGL